MAVVEQAVQDGRGHHRVAQHLAPGTDRLVAGDQEAALFVAPADQVEQEMAAGPHQGQVAQFVQDQQVGPAEMDQGIVQGPMLLGLGELVDQVQGSDEPAAVALLDGLPPQADGQVRLSDSGRPQEQDVGGVGQVPPGLQFGHQAPVHARLQVEIVGLQGPVQGELGQLGPEHGPFCILGGHLLPDDLVQEVQEAQLGPGPLVQDAVQAGFRAHKLEPAQVAFQALHARVVGHASPPTTRS